jgi:1,3-beta-glucan synthase component
MTRGGVSKASKGINLSEDIFAGYNNCIRGGQVRTSKEHMTHTNCHMHVCPYTIASATYDVFR